MKRHSSLTDEELAAYLAKIRRIAKMSDDDAIIELDEFVHRFSKGTDLSEPDEGKDWALEQAQSDLRDLANQIAEARRTLGSHAVRRWDLERLEDAAGGIGEDWTNPEIRKALASQVEKLRNEGLALVEECRIQATENTIIQAHSDHIATAASIRSILMRLQDAETYLRGKNRLTPEIEKHLFTHRERCAWFRARKKLMDAEVASGTGDESKAEKRRAEASVILRQDWEVTFPDGRYPIPGIE